MCISKIVFENKWCKKFRKVSFVGNGDEGKLCVAKYQLKLTGITLEFLSKVQLGWSNEDSTDWENEEWTADINTESKKKIPLNKGGGLCEIFF